MRSFSGFLIIAVLVCVFSFQTAYGAGFALYEGSARGNALGGSLIATADDPSAIFYNPAGITQLEGTEIMAGATFIRPSIDIKTMTPMGELKTSSENNTWIPPHLYGTFQLNDKFWAGFGLYSRFGLGTEFDEDWPGRYNSYNAVIKTFSLNPDIAWKLNDKLSLAAGVSAMWMDLKLQRKIPVPSRSDMDFTLKGDSWGYGYNVALRYKPLSRVEIGVSYQSEVEQSLDGDADIEVGKTGADGDVTLPQMLSLGVGFHPVDRIHLELSAIYTGWSSYDELKISFDNPALLGTSESTSVKDWDNVWRYQFGLEYKVTDALDIQLGYVYDQSPIPDRTADYLIPANDRQLYSLGGSYHWTNWTLDLSYTYLKIDDRTIAGRAGEGILPSQFEDGYTHLFGVSVSTQL